MSYIAWSLGAHRKRGTITYTPNPTEYTGTVPAAVTADPYLATTTSDAAGIAALVADKLKVALTASADALVPVFPKE
jgi:hypothetical protein